MVLVTPYVRKTAQLCDCEGSFEKKKVQLCNESWKKNTCRMYIYIYEYIYIYKCIYIYIPGSSKCVKYVPFHQKKPTKRQNFYMYIHIIYIYLYTCSYILYVLLVPSSLAPTKTTHLRPNQLCRLEQTTIWVGDWGHWGVRGGDWGLIHGDVLQ